ncbi:MAG: accessory gene regulator B family protein [Bacillota bacterium]|nr:accessory gene regulator B family protein [Bacillota bacterium]
MKKVAEKLVQLNMDLNTGEKASAEVILFGLRLIIHSVLHVAIILVLAYFFGFFYEAMVALVVGSTMKVFSGGAHANHIVKCIIVGTIIYLLIGFSGKHLGSIVGVNYLIWIVVSLFALYSTYKLAPAPAKNKPIKSFAHKENLKKLALNVVSVAIFLSFIVGYILEQSGLFYGVLLALLWQSLSLWPLTFRILESI